MDLVALLLLLTGQPSSNTGTGGGVHADSGGIPTSPPTVPTPFPTLPPPNPK